MLKIFITGCLLLVLCCALYGWGRALRRLLRLAKGSYGVTIVLGLGLWVFLGGILNLSKLARPQMLDALVVVGLGLLVFYAGRDMRFPELSRCVPSYRWVGQGCLLVFAVVVIAFTIATQFPPACYNYHDDFEKYLVYPVKMLQTGTLSGSSLSSVGLETLGGQAFLQGFLLAHFPVQYLNGFDAVFALLLCILLAGNLGTRSSAMAPALVLGPLLVVSINPQYVNISALYLGGAFLLGLFLVLGDPEEIGEHGNHTASPAITAGLLYAALIALKTTFALVVCLHLGFTFLAVMLVHRSFSKGIVWAATALIACGVALSPWVALHSGHYIDALSKTPSATTETARSVSSTAVNIFSTSPLFWGASYAHYTFLVVLTVMCVVPAALIAKRDHSQVWRWSGSVMLGGCLATLGAYLVALLVAGRSFLDAPSALRYTVPLLIAAPTAGVSLAILYWRRVAGRNAAAQVVILSAVALVAISSFFRSLTARIDQARHFGSILAFSKLATDPGYIRYNHDVFEGSLSNKLATIQAQVPAGEPLLVWVDTPFYLDFGRNPITDVDMVGIGAPWATMPQARYILWEYRGNALQRLGDFERIPGPYPRRILSRAKSFVKRLADLTSHSETLYNDGRLALFRLPASESIQPDF